MSPTISLHRDETTVWRPVVGYVCRMCETPAQKSAADPHLWSCPSCGFSTYSVYFNFKECKRV